MVTFYPSKNSSNSSLSLSSSSTTSSRPAYATSQAGSSTVSRGRERTTSQYTSRSSNVSDQNRHRRSPSVASTSSQSTLVPSQVSAPRSIAGYPTAPPSAYSNYSNRASNRAPSVASTSAVRNSSSERHRASRRSRTLDQEPVRARPAPQNEFPWFGQTGDVDIEITDTRGQCAKRYLLHRLILAQNSRWFDNDLSKDKVLDTYPRLPGSNTVALINNNGERRRYELDWSRCREQKNGLPLLNQVVSVSRGQLSDRPPATSLQNKPPPPSTSFFRNLASNFSNDAPPSHQSDDEDVLAAYENLFLIFYNYSPKLSTSNIATAYVESKLLLSLASSYSALAVVGPRIDYHLLRFGSRLWKQIAKYPPSYLKLGYLARSRAIFAESLVHVVGQWPTANAQLKRAAVDGVVIDLVEDKIDELEEMKLRAEAKLFRINLTTPRGEQVNPFNSYVDWLALSLFRQWIADHVISKPDCSNAVSSAGRSFSASRAGSGEVDSSKIQSQTSSSLVKAYRLLGQGGQTYLTHDDLKRFLKAGPRDYSRENIRKLERRMEELKSLAKEAVRPLTRSWLELDVTSAEDSAGGTPSLSYLTCIRCEERDFAYIWKE